MTEHDLLAESFEAHRARLRGVAYRMLGSAAEADDAVQEAWLRLSRSDSGDVANPAGWLTTVVARVCLDMLRSRKSRREESLDAAAAVRRAGGDPEDEALMADSIGLALLVVLDTLEPAERLAFVMHDMFAVSFDEIASIIGRSPAAARQLASRARRRVQGKPAAPRSDLDQQKEVVDAFLAALRGGDFEGLLAVLDPDLIVRSDTGAAGAGAASEVRGAREWAKGAVAWSHGARFAVPALVDGSVGLVLAPGGRLVRALRFAMKDGKIAGIDVIGEPQHLRELELSVLS